MLMLQNPAKALAMCREALQLLREENEGSPRFGKVYYDAFQICVCHGDFIKAKAFATLAADTVRFWQGSDASGVEDIESVARNPETHPSALYSKRWHVGSAQVPSPYSDEWLWSRAG